MSTVWRVTRAGVRRPGYVWVWIDTNGDLPAPCTHCGGTVTEWGKRAGQGIVHHADENRSNHDPSNLVLMHQDCHTSEHMTGKPKGADHRRRIGDAQRGRRGISDATRARIAAGAARKLTREKADAIRTDPRTHAAIAAEYGVSESMVWQIKAGRTWRV